MPKKLIVFAVVLLAVLGTAIPSAAQEDQGGGTLEPVGPSPELECEQVAGQETLPTVPEAADPSFQQANGEGAPGEQVVVTEDGGTVPCDQQVNQAAEESGIGNFSIQSAPACALCSDSVLEEAEEAILSGGSGETTPTDAFGVALDAARSSGDIREAAASEDTSGGAVEDTAAYLAAYDAAREAGADEETAREAALQAVADLSDEAAPDADGSGSVDDAKGGAATSKKAARGKAASSKGKASENDAGKDRERDPGKRAGVEETTGEGEEVEDGGEDGGVDGEKEEDVATSAESGAPLLMGGGVLLVTGLFVIFRVTRSR